MVRVTKGQSPRDWTTWTRKYPKTDVSKEEMLKLCLAQGQTEEQAKQAIQLCETLGNRVLIGVQLVGLIKETPKTS